MKIKKINVIVLSILVFSIVVDIDILSILCAVLYTISFGIAIIYIYAFILYKRISPLNIKDTEIGLLIKRLTLYNVGESVASDKFLIIKFLLFGVFLFIYPNIIVYLKQLFSLIL